MNEVHYKILGIKKICRTCLSTLNKLKSLLKNEDLLNMLTLLTPARVEKNDPFPKHICAVCISKLNVSHNFIDMIIRAEHKLKKDLEKDGTTYPQDSDSDSDSEDSNVEDVRSDNDSDSFAFSIADDDLFEFEEHKLKEEDFDEARTEIWTSEGDPNFSGFQIADVKSVSEDADMVEEGWDSQGLENSASCSSFKGFDREEINNANFNLGKYTETLQNGPQPPTMQNFYGSITFKCYLCEKILDFQCDDFDLKALIFSNLCDDDHILCRKRLKILRKIIKELYLKQDELISLNISWQKIFFKRAQQKRNRRVAKIPTNPVIDTPTNPHEIGYRRDGQVHLGHLTWIPEADFDKVFRCSVGPHKFLVNMALVLFGAETLAKSTITGVSKNGVKKAPLNAIRLCALKSSLKYYMKVSNIPEYYQNDIWKNFNGILGRKIFQISSQYKKRFLENTEDENCEKAGKSSD